MSKQTIWLQIFKRLSSTNFTWFILEYFVPNINVTSITSYERHMPLFIYYFRKIFRKTNISYSGVYWEIFQGSEGFVKTGHFDKHFVKK